jgi:predicted aspartyl protease
MKIRLEGGLPFVTVSLTYRETELTLDGVLLDTGSGASVFAADEVARLGLVPEPTDVLRRVVGVGGAEFVFSKRVEKLTLGDLSAENFEIQVGAMDYGFPIQGLLGMDFLLRSAAIINLGRLEISQGLASSRS